MAIYAAAVSSGMGAAQELLTGSSAQSTAAFNAAYDAQARRLAAASLKNTAEKNISAIKQDKILTNSAIQMKQNAAEAMIKVNAATSGVEGGSVDDTIYSTEANESFAINRNKRQADQAIEGQLAKVNSAQASLLSVRDEKISATGNLLKAATSLDSGDFAAMGESFGFEKPKQQTLLDEARNDAASSINENIFGAAA